MLNAQVEPEALETHTGFGGAAPAPVPDPEVPAKAKRRQFTAEKPRPRVPYTREEITAILAASLRQRRIRAPARLGHGTVAPEYALRVSDVATLERDRIRDGQIFPGVFRRSGVKGSSEHRFRHTLATEVLVQGGSIEDAANLLGDSPR